MMTFSYQKAGRLFCLLLGIIGCLTITNVVTVYATEPSSWALEEVLKATEINAYTQSLIDDYQGALSREDFVELLVKTYEAVTDEVIDISTVKIPFTDTDQLHVIKAYTIGIANGTSATTFSPDQLVTREQMMVMLMRMVEEVELKRKVTIFTVEASDERYQDDGQISGWAREAIYKAKNNGIITGTGDHTFNPKSYSTKEQALIINYRLLMEIVATDKVSIMWNINLEHYEEDVRVVAQRTLGDYETSDRKAFVTADVLRLRSEPSTDRDESVIDRLFTYEEVVILEEVDEWYKIAASGNRIGYVHRDYLHEYEVGQDDGDVRAQIVTYAKQFIGTPYRYAGKSLTDGIDCSGFTKQVMRPYGYVLSSSSSGQGSNGYAIAEAELLPGDLVVYGYNNSISHVAMYIGNDKIIHATTSRGVMVTDMRGYLYKPLIGFRRVIF